MGHCTPKTMNAAGFYLLLLAVFILTSILNANFRAQFVLILMVGHFAPIP